MRRSIRLILPFIAALALVLVPTAPAHADSAVGCRISPSATWQHTPEWCYTDRVASRYTVSFYAEGWAGAVFTWTRSGGGTISNGCISTTNYCNLYVYGAGVDQAINATVRVHVNGVLVHSSSATAYLPAICGTELC